MLRSKHSEDLRMLDYESVHCMLADLRKKQIFFVGGAIKSGTTWLQLLLDAHPDVSCNGEGQFAGNGLGPMLWAALDQHGQLIAQKNKSIFSELAGYPRLSDEDFHYLLATCIGLYLLRQRKQKPQARAIGERSPGNMRFFDVLYTLFPAAKFLHIVRDGRDCAVSGWFHNLRVSPNWANEKFDSMDAYVVDYVQGWAKNMAGVQKFAEQHPGRVRQLRYEDLLTNTESVLADIFGFLGVDTTTSVLASCRSSAAFEKLSGGRAAGQENRNSFFRKGVAGDWRNHLTKEMEAAVRQRAGHWLDRFGYK
jgi:sulfotransferase family protein